MRNLGGRTAESMLRELPGHGATGDEFLITTTAVSNDTGYTGGKHWGMYGDKTSPANQYGSQAGEAWAAGHIGSTKVAVGVIDSGIDYTHADLYLNIWLNQGEIPTAFKGSLVDYDNDLIIGMRDLNASQNAAYVKDLNGNNYIDAGDLLADSRWENKNDQDGNGYVDDLIGWDFVGNDNDPYDDNGHGTHVAGTIGAIGGNGIGAAGVAWQVQMVALKFLDASGSGSSTAAIKAIDYFTNASKTGHGIDFVATNNSWGGGGYSTSLNDAIARGAARDILFVGAAGNGGGDSVGDDNDATPHYPANYNTTAKAGYDAVVSVASITSSGARSSFSNYGDVTVDLGAPGSYIYSTLAGGGYGYMSGTSMATPHVAGAIALYAAANPGASAADIKAALLNATIDTASLAGRTVTGGRLDVAAMLGEAPVAPTEPSGATITGTSGNDTLAGGAGDDTLDGLAGHDRLDGGTGADRTVGGAGNDIHYVDNSGDTVVENSGGGFDSVRTSKIGYTLPDQVERLYLDGTAALSGTGNSSSNHLHGNGGANTLRGLAGGDSLWGKGGNDRLEGGDGNDMLYGGTGADTLVGGNGNDRFAWNSAGEVGLGSGRDTIVGFAQGQDKLDLTRIDAIAGTSINDYFGFIGKGAFSGIAGQLRYLTGGSGSDAYMLLQGDTNGDKVADFELMLSGQALTLEAGDFTLLESATSSETEVTITGTSGNDTLAGGDGDDTLDGLAGHDRLDGGAGADRTVGGAGNDIHYVDNSGDAVVENSGGGFDSVRTSKIGYTLPDQVERLYLDGSAALSGTGNSSSNHLHGNGGANTLRGLAGRDALWGKGGNDRLEGGDGDDTLYGGTDADTLVGGNGDDRFAWSSAGEVGLGSGRDTILDFAQGQDKLDLSRIDAKAGTSTNDAFSFIGTNAFSGVAGQLRYQSSGGSTLIQADNDGDRIADFEVLLQGFADPLQTADFIL